MKRVHITTLPEQSGREISLDRLSRLTAILLACARGAGQEKAPGVSRGL